MNHQTINIATDNQDWIHPLLGAYYSGELGKVGGQDYAILPATYASFEELMENKKLEASTRKDLVEAMQEQYAKDGIELGDGSAVGRNIELLKKENTYTITTGHQLQTFGGPMFFWYKMIHAIELAKELKARYPEREMVPIYWMASEDHDFEEIASIEAFGKKFTWEEDSQGKAVGSLEVNGLETILNELVGILQQRNAEPEIVVHLHKAYEAGNSLSTATRTLVHEVLGQYGIVCLDANSPQLKRHFVEIASGDIEQEGYAKKLKESNLKIEQWSPPLHPRTCNLFYFNIEGSRQRIDLVEIESGLMQWQTKDGQNSWSKEEILAELRDAPERFSPNVALRPMYQEQILPNLCYIGGTNELAYWIQLRPLFAMHGVAYPLPVLRKSALLLSGKQLGDWQGLKLDAEDLLLKSLKQAEAKYIEVNDLLHPSLEEISSLQTQLQKVREALQGLPPANIGVIVKDINEQQKVVKGWTQTVQKAMKEREEASLQKMSKLHGNFYPNGTPQERVQNYLPWQLSFQGKLFEAIRKAFGDENGDLLTPTLSIISN